MVRFIFIITVFIISGCATTTPKITNLNTSLGVSKADLNENMGILVGTYTKNIGEIEYGKRRLFFTDTKDYEPRYAIDKKGFSNILGHQYTVKDSAKEGDAFAFVLPAGEYILYNFSLESGQNYSQTWSSSENFSIPFVVEPNKVNYLGEFNFTAFSSERTTIIGIKSTNREGGYWIVTDELERDKKYFAQKYKALPMDDIKNIVPKTKRKQTPFVILPNELEAFNKSKEKIAADGNNPIIGDPVKPFWMTCKKPYALEQDCSIWSNFSKKKLRIDGYDLKVSASKDGKTILVMERGSKTVTFNDSLSGNNSLNSSYHSIAKIFKDNGIVVNTVRPLKETAGVSTGVNLSGYFLLLEQDGYSLLDQYKVKSNK